MIRINTFSGIAPKLSRQLIPDNMARDARNCRLLSGELRGIGQLRMVHDFGNSAIKSAYRLPDGANPDIWVGFNTPDIDFVDAPLINDTYERFLWTGNPSQAFVAVNSKQRLRDGLPAYRVGVPFPTSAPLVASTVGGDLDLTETRAYIYTFVNEWGEESAPSPPILGSGPADAQWNLANLSATPPDSGSRIPIVKRRIYRTITGQSSALYYFVADINNMADTTYEDTQQSSDVVQRTICQTFNFDPPPDGLKGLIAHPSGALAGFVGNEVHLSVPYRVHAWPVEFIIALEHDIVGLAIYGNMLMALTTSNPYYLMGTHPSNLTPTQSQSIEPCLSKRSIAATLQGVIYASPNGLVAFNEMGATVITNSLISKKEWQQQFSPETVKAAQYGMQYLAFKDSSNGFEYSPAEPLGALSTFDRFVNIDNVQTDRYDGVVLALSNGVVFEWDHPDEVPVYYTWRSKEFDLPRPLNFGACIIKSDDSAPLVAGALAAVDMRNWNTTRAQRPLNPIGYTPIGGSRWAMTPSIGTPDFNPDTNSELTGVDRRQYPVGGSSLFQAGVQAADGVAVFRVYADRRLVATLAVVPNQTMRLPSGFKAHNWQFELLSNTNTYSIAVAETAKGLMNV